MAPGDATGPSSRRQFLKTAGLASGVALLAGCAEDDGSPGTDGGDGGGDGGDGGGDGDGDGGGGTATGNGSEEPIVIGGLYGFSGLFPEQSADHEDGFRYALEEINGDGGVLGREVVLEAVDTEGDPSTALTQYTRFIEQDDVIAAVGPVTSDVSIQVANEAESREVPFLPQIAASHALLSRDSRYTFRTACHASPAFAQAAIQLIEDRDYTQAGVVYADFAWGHSYQAVLNQQMPDGVTLEEFTSPVTETDFTSSLRQMSEDLEILLAAGHPPGAPNMYTQALELGLAPEVVPGAANPPEINFNTMGEVATQSFANYSIVDVLSDEYRSLAEQYGNDNDKFLDTGDATGYVNAHLLATAIEEAGSADPAELADALRGISFDTIYNDPISYTEYGEFDGMSLLYAGFVAESPDYYPDVGFQFEEVFRSEPLTFDPDSIDV